MYRRFHPTPSSTSAHQKFATSTPASATPMHTRFTATPASITLSTPKRLIMLPVTNDGANMPTTCDEMTVAAAA